MTLRPAWPGGASATAGLHRRRSVRRLAHRRRHRSSKAAASSSHANRRRIRPLPSTHRRRTGGISPIHRHTRQAHHNDLPMALRGADARATDDALIVNWFSIEILNRKGKRTYYNSFITDRPVTTGTVAELAACGRARWKIENETFNVLKMQRIQSGTQHRARQGNPRLGPGDTQPARLRDPNHREPGSSWCRGTKCWRGWWTR